MKRLIALLAMVAMAAPAMAQQLTAETYNVNVTIDVQESVSMWAGHENVTLVMDGADGNNSATFESTLSTINNVDAKIDVSVDGTLPTPNVPGGGINFFIFDGGDSTSAVAAITANAYNPAGALVWNQATLGDTQEFDDFVALSNSIVNRAVVYASASPGENPNVAQYDLDVLWTISPL